MSLANRIRWRILTFIDSRIDNVCWADLCDYRDGFIRGALTRRHWHDAPLPGGLCKAPCWCGKADALNNRSTDDE